ncbi:hypothetical protein PV08_00714 [Exophiala spinifera]|uniref:Uncharacterized protein n=1 Tax=Exophiala spinifera TaxID=91928 RepID=A0A0D2C988_9EURO|nr:uncharacterized protein PV08_00714 [Exophiala spinifera]KIW20139.1 hypothetical protein PV08_00714 [Exophiala spinifera]
MSSAQDADLMDIDIDMDLDLDDHGPALDEELDLEEGEEPSFVPSGARVQDTSALIPAIYTEDPALEPQWNKVHIRGVDEMHTNDILGFVHDHFSEVGDNVHIQWIDDTSANICFKDNEMAKRAQLAFVATPITEDQLVNAPFELRAAKPLASRPASMLVVRVAQQGDRKKKNARDASRYYLLHPDQDPTERMRRGFAESRAEAGDYRRRRFDDREMYRRRRDNNDDDGKEFTANMYDDAPATDTEAAGRGRDLFSRVSKGRRRSASPSRRTRNSDEIDISDSEDDTRTRRRGYRDRNDRNPRSNAGKELFGSASAPPKGGGGLHSDRIELFPNKGPDTDAQMSIEPNTASSSRPATDPANSRANAAAAKRLKADLLSAAQTSPRSNHRRSHAMDAKNEEDLAQRFARKSISIDSTKSFKNGGLANAGIELFPSANSNGGGLSIKGSAGGDGGFSIKGSGGLSIKGRAEAKELFPNQYQRESGRNEGKELFDQPVREKRVRRRAGDLFD